MSLLNVNAKKMFILMNSLRLYVTRNLHNHVGHVLLLILSKFCCFGVIHRPTKLELFWDCLSTPCSLMTSFLKPVISMMTAALYRNLKKETNRYRTILVLTFHPILITLLCTSGTKSWRSDWWNRGSRWARIDLPVWRKSITNQSLNHPVSYILLCRMLEAFLNFMLISFIRIGTVRSLKLWDCSGFWSAFF